MVDDARKSGQIGCPAFFAGAFNFALLKKTDLIFGKFLEPKPIVELHTI